ncbi:hypothetical protein BDW75DRAFT_231622 [Aspergillus navahoensis]
MKSLLSLLLLTPSTVLSMPVNTPTLSRRQFNTNANSNLDTSTNAGTNTAISIPDGPVYNEHDFFTSTYTENTTPSSNSGEEIGYTEAGSDTNIAIPGGPAVSLGENFENTYQESTEEQEYDEPETTPVPVPVSVPPTVPEIPEEEIPTPSLPLPPPPTSTPPSVDIYTPVPVPPVETGESEGESEAPIPVTEDDTATEKPGEPVEEEEIGECLAPEPEAEFVHDPQDLIEEAKELEPAPVLATLPEVEKSCSCA